MNVNTPTPSANRIHFRKAVALIAAVATGALFFGRAMAEDKAPEPEVKTLTGFPVDIICYADGHSGLGTVPDCAETCVAKNGMPAGFVVKEEGKNFMYIVTGGNSRKVHAKLTPFYNKMSKATGEVIQVDNIRLFDIESIELDEPAK